MEEVRPDPAFGLTETLPAHLGESDFQAHCEYVAHGYGWIVYHETDSRKSPKGLPDLILLSPPQADGSVVLVMLELKNRTGKLTPDQEVWQAGLAAVTDLVVGVVRPRDWESFVALCYDPRRAIERATPND